jgi:hypothetical protein
LFVPRLIFEILKFPMMPTPIYYIPLKDPSSPKHDDPDYIHFANEMYEQFKMHHPNITYDQLPKFTYSMYDKAFTCRKGSWEARALADKTRYLQELADYVCHSSRV